MKSVKVNLRASSKIWNAVNRILTTSAKDDVWNILYDVFLYATACVSLIETQLKEKRWNKNK